MPTESYSNFGLRSTDEGPAARHPPEALHEALGTAAGAR